MRGVGSSQKGFTLIEVLVTIALFGFLMSVTVSYTLQLYQINEKSRRVLEQTTQAQKTLERAKVLLLQNYETPPTFLGEGVECENRDVFGRRHQWPDCSDRRFVPPMRRLSLRQGLTEPLQVDVAPWP